MTMASWPSIANPIFPLEGHLRREQVRSTSDAGYVHSRPKWTRARGSWTLKWTRLSASDLATLSAFFAANAGDTFTWTHPATATTYTVRFAEDELGQYSLVSPGWYELTVQIEEA